MPEPLFTDTLQIGFVVRDLDASMHTYFHEYGIGPWEIFEVSPASVTDMTQYEQPAEYAMRIGIAMVGKVQWELIQPLDDKSNYAEFLAAKGEGVHHVGVAVRDYTKALSALRDKGHTVLMGGVYAEIPYSYMSTHRDLGVIAEIYDWPSGRKPTPDAVYPSNSA
jgi:hypothetical protein